MADGWKQLEFDLSAFQYDATFELTIDFIGKYYYLYYQGGDAVWVDNVEIVLQTSGDVEGYAYNNAVAEEGVEVGFLAETPPYPPNDKCYRILQFQQCTDISNR